MLFFSSYLVHVFCNTEILNRMPRKKEDPIKAINQKLKVANAHLTLEERGGWLSLRGTLPPKPNSGIEHDSQQRISLRIAANPKGLNDAYDLALEIRGLLNQGRFDWNRFLSQPKPETFGDMIAGLERDYLATGGKLDAWNKEYVAKVYKKIPNWDKPFNLEVLRRIIEGTDFDSRTRNRCVDAMAMLADFAGVDHDLRRLRGSYSAFHPVNPRHLPSDESLAMWFHKISNPLWRNAFGLQVIYGLRNYEIFKLDLSEFPQNPIVFCHRGKTKLERFIFPLFPEWVEAWFQDDSVELPNCNGDNQALGNRVTVAYNRFGIEFDGNDIRHSYSRRAFDCGLPIETAARSMGHRVDVHEAIYQHWITLGTYKANYDRVMSHPDRPRPKI